MEHIAWMAWTLPTAIFFVMLGGACVMGWKLDAQKHADIRTELERRDALVSGGALYEEAPILQTLGDAEANQ